jgi:hypothetical protein
MGDVLTLVVEGELVVADDFVVALVGDFSMTVIAPTIEG